MSECACALSRLVQFRLHPSKQAEEAAGRGGNGAPGAEPGRRVQEALHVAAAAA